MSHDSDWHEEIAGHNQILLTEVGSGLHGVTINGTDDHDEMGVCIPPPRCVIGLEQFEQYQDRWHDDGTRILEGQRSYQGDTDHVTYSLNKFARLAAAGNPTVLMPLFAPIQSIEYMNSWGLQLRDNRHLFITKQAGYRFAGYLKAQTERMLGLRGRRHTNRPELVEQYGFDTKCAYHAIRLAIQGIELMTTGEIELPMSPWNRAYLREVRQGQYTLDQVVAELYYQAWLLDKATSETHLPEDTDFEVLNDFLIDMHHDWWAHKGMWKVTL